MSDIGKRIREIRLERGMTVTELSRRSGLSHPTISGYEHGHKEPIFDNAERIMAALGYKIVFVPEDERN